MSEKIKLNKDEQIRKIEEMMQKFEPNTKVWNYLLSTKRKLEEE